MDVYTEHCVMCGSPICESSMPSLYLRNKLCDHSDPEHKSQGQMRVVLFLSHCSFLWSFTAVSLVSTHESNRPKGSLRGFHVCVTIATHLFRIGERFRVCIPFFYFEFHLIKSAWSEGVCDKQGGVIFLS